MSSSRHLGWLLPVALPILLLCWVKYLPKPNRPQAAPSELETAQPEPGAAQPKPQPVSKQNQPTCFRISGIPPDWDRARLKKELQTIDPGFDNMGAMISGPFPDSYGYTALLDLNECTSYFTFEPNQEKHVLINESDRRARLVLDKHFYDLTPLNRAEVPIEMELVYPQKGVFQMLKCVPTV